MNIIDIKNKVVYNEINSNIANFLLESECPVASIDDGRELHYTTISYGEDEMGMSMGGYNELIDDFTAAEKEKGINILKEFWKNQPEKLFAYGVAVENINIMRMAKLEEMKAKYASAQENYALKVEGVGIVNGGEEHLKNAKDFYENFEIMSGGEDVIEFRTYNNSFVKITKEDLKKIYTVMFKKSCENRQKKWDYEQKISKARSLKTLEFDIEF